MNIQMNSITTISVAKQTAVPADVLRALNLEPRDRLIWEIDKKYGRVSIRALTKNWVKNLRGMARGTYGSSAKIAAFIKDGRRDRKV